MNVAGPAIQATYNYVQERFGKEALEKVLKHAAFTEPGVPSTVLISSWYPFSLYQSLGEAINQTLGTGDYQILRELGAFSAEQGFKLFGAAAPKTPQNLMSQIKTVFWPSYFDFGSVEILQPAPNDFLLRLLNIPQSRTLCQRIFGFALKGLQLTGAKNINYEETGCLCKGSPHCEFRGAWE